MIYKTGHRELKFEQREPNKQPDGKKSLKIPKGQSETVYRRRIDNTMAKRKRTKGQTTIKKHTYKTKDGVTRTPLKTEAELGCPGRISSSCSTSGTRRVNLVTTPVISFGIGKDGIVITNQQIVYIYIYSISRYK